MLLWADRSIKKRDPYKYPEGNLFSISIQIKTNLIYSLGRTRLQNVYIIMLSVLMCAASVQIIIQSSKILSQDIQYLQNKHNASSTETLHNIDMTTFPIIAMVFSIGKI